MNIDLQRYSHIYICEYLHIEVCIGGIGAGDSAAVCGDAGARGAGGAHAAGDGARGLPPQVPVSSALRQYRDRCLRQRLSLFLGQDLSVLNRVASHLK